jgi:hypothetical protein
MIMDLQPAQESESTPLQQTDVVPRSEGVTGALMGFDAAVAAAHDGRDLAGIGFVLPRESVWRARQRSERDRRLRAAQKRRA